MGVDQGLLHGGHRRPPRCRAGDGGTDKDQAVALLLAETKRLDASELKRAGRHLLRVLDPEGEDRRDEAALAREERAAHHGRPWRLSLTHAGRAHFIPPPGVDRDRLPQPWPPPDTS